VGARNTGVSFAVAVTFVTEIGDLQRLRWLAQQKFDHPAQQTAFQDAVDTIEDAVTR
jgi:hypothetical protein